TGRCCQPNGSCMVTTLDNCSEGVGGWFQGQTCASSCPPPPPVLNITVDAPGAVVSGEQYAYTLTVRNVGLGAANTVRVRAGVPSGATFVSAPGGSMSGGIVTFSVDVLAPGQSRVFMQNVRANCVSATSQIINSTVSALAANYPTLTAPNVITTVQPLPAA